MVDPFTNSNIGDDLFRKDMLLQKASQQIKQLQAALDLNMSRSSDVTARFPVSTPLTPRQHTSSVVRETPSPAAHTYSLQKQLLESMDAAQTHQEEIEKLRDQISDMTVENHALGRQVERLEAENFDLTSQLANAQHTLSETKAALSSAQERCDSTEVNMNLLKDQVTVLEKDREEALGMLREYREVTDELEAKTKQSTEVATWKARAEAKDRELDAALERLSTMNQRLDATTTDVVQQTDRSSYWEAKYRETKERLDKVTYSTLVSSPNALGPVSPRPHSHTPGRPSCIWRDCLYGELSFLENWIRTHGGVADGRETLDMVR